MSASAERIKPTGSERPALLPEVMLGLDTTEDLQLVGVTVGSPDEVLRVLTEPSLSQRAVPKRRAEFAAGRHAAALALARYGCTAAVPRAANGAPLWPPGFVGSISHGAGIAVAVAAQTRDYRGLGVDVEQWISDEQCAEIAHRVLCPAELALLAAAFPGLSYSRRLSLGFSAKESLYKCLNPIAEEFIEFEDAVVSHIEPRSPTSGSIRLSLGKAFTAELACGTEVPGCYALRPGRIETLVWLRRRRS